MASTRIQQQTATTTAAGSNIQSIVSQEDWFHDGLTIFVVGASGDLAKKKTYPSLFQLYRNGFLPKDTLIWGYARSAKTHDELRQQLRPHLLKNKDNDDIEALCDSFLHSCYYKQGKSYGDEEAWLNLIVQVQEYEAQFPAKQHHNRLFYLAIPPNVFGETSLAIRKTAMNDANNNDSSSSTGWSRLIIEKPFGRDLQTCRELSNILTNVAQFEEQHLYRIDHYLGKEVVQNLLIWRFGNSIYEWLWNRHAIQSVHIQFKEPFGTEGRGGYFDNFGIIRDIIQNHLLQILMLLAMEAPIAKADSEDGHARSLEDVGNAIRDAKTRLLQSISPIELEGCDDVLLGQYDGYKDDETIQNKETVCPTYAAVRCRICNPRWDGVPFILEAGKALEERLCQVCIQFRPSSTMSNLFGMGKGMNVNAPLQTNELVMRLQPDPAIYFTSNIKSPGFASQPTPIQVGMDYGSLRTAANAAPTDLGNNNSNPDAYTRLILEALRGRQGSFVRSDELLRSWEIFTPLLHAIEQTNPKPFPYAYGSTGPTERAAFFARHGVALNTPGTTSMPPELKANL